MRDLKHKLIKRKLISLPALGILLVFGIPAQPCMGQSSPSDAPTTTQSPHQIQIELKSAQGSSDIDAKLKKRLIGYYQSAMGSMEASEAYAAKAKVFKQSSKSAPSWLEKTTRALAKAERASGASIWLPKGINLRELEQRLLKDQAELASIDGERADLDKKLQNLHGRPDAARKQLAQARVQLEKIEEELNVSPAGEAPLLAKARKTALRASQQARINEIRMLDQERLTHGIRLKLVTTQRDLAAKKASRIRARIQLLQDRVNQLRQSEAERTQKKTLRAESEASGKHPAIRDLARKNAELGAELSNAVAGLERVNASREALSVRLKQIEQDAAKTRQWLEKAGLSEALGQVLRGQRRKILDLRRYRKEGDELQAEIAKVSLGQFRVEEMQRDLGDLEAAVAQIMDKQVEAATPVTDRNEIAAEVRGLLGDRQNLLRKLGAAQTDYLWALGDLDATQKQFVTSVRQYTAFLDEHLLWNPSASPLDMGMLSDVIPALGRLFSPVGWGNIIRSSAHAVRTRPFRTGAAVFVFVALLWLRRRRLKALESIAKYVQVPHSDRFSLTIQAMTLSLLAAAPWPLLAGVVGWWLQSHANAAEIAGAAGMGLSALSMPLLLILLLRVICLPKGVAIVHFGWRDEAASLWRRHLSWLMPIFLPSLFISAFAGWQGGEGYAASLGRLGFMVGMVALAVFFQLVLHPKGGVFGEYLRHNPEVWLSRFRYQWFAISIAAPLILATLAAAGYYYTALQLKTQLFATIGLLAGISFFHAMVVRWLAVSKRKLALIQFQERQKAKASDQASAAVPADKNPGKVELTAFDTPGVGLETVDDHIRKLLRTVTGITLVVGLWLIWTEAFPALAFLDDVTLWQQSIMQDGREILQPVTLANLAVAIVLALATFGAARNLPGVLEIAFLNRLSIESGSRYAITTISRYAIATIGIIMVSDALGLSWSKVQWLVAAMGVGLGFGLQEIVANFVSGLIILFERPIRIGDTVTVNDVSGTVSRIRIRATTITDWDRKELIVPNKAFITGSLVNWTLSDPITRVVIKVGIAYGSDIALAHKEMLKVVKSIPLVLDEPEASIYFIDFGDSSLDFVVRAFVKDLDSRLPLIHQLHLKIEEALRLHGIEIPFPQRDVHVRSVVVEED